MKIFKMQKQGFVLDKAKGTLTRFGMSACSFKDIRSIPKEDEFKYENAKEIEREWVEGCDFLMKMASDDCIVHYYYALADLYYSSSF